MLHIDCIAPTHLRIWRSIQTSQTSKASDTINRLHTQSHPLSPAIRAIYMRPRRWAEELSPTCSATYRYASLHCCMFISLSFQLMWVLTHPVSHFLCPNAICKFEFDAVQAWKHCACAFEHSLPHDSSSSQHTLIPPLKAYDPNGEKLIQRAWSKNMNSFHPKERLCTWVEPNLPTWKPDSWFIAPICCRKLIC